MHAAPLYTSKRTTLRDPTAPRKTYGQAQVNALYGVRNRASLDPFTAVPMYSQKFVPEERALPEWAARPVCRELFPPELLDTVEPLAEGGGDHKRRRLELSKVSALPNAERAFGMTRDADDDDEDGAGRKTLLDKLAAMGEEEGEEGAEVEDEEVMEEEEEDEAYDDEDAGDYDAENYFDNGDEMGEDVGDGDEGEGTF